MKLLIRCILNETTFAGTPPRIDKSTINFEPLWKQVGDDPPTPFSFMNEVNGLEVYSTTPFLIVTVDTTDRCVDAASPLPPDSH